MVINIGHEISLRHCDTALTSFWDSLGRFITFAVARTAQQLELCDTPPHPNRWAAAFSPIF
jgi:hypothetical protein